MGHITLRVLLASTIIALTLAVSLSRAALSAPAVDASFAHFYYTNGGARLLGPAIAPRQGAAQYFELGRLEDGRGQEVSRDWQIAMGRVAAELIEQSLPIPVSGDSGPDYALLHEQANPGRRVPPPTPVDGIQPVEGGMFVPFDPSLRATPGQVVPDRFWRAMNDPEQFPTGWLHAVGLPLTPAITAEATTGTTPRSLIIQGFERTVLIHDPADPTGRQVERAEVGLHALAPRGGPAPEPVYPDWKGEYFANADLSGEASLIRNDTRIDFDWQSGAPGAGLPDDLFSVRWTRDLHILTATTYRVRVRADDGVRVWIDGRLIVDRWPGLERAEGLIFLPVGDYPARVEYREARGEASISLELAPIEPVRAWQGTYYNNDALAGRPFFERDDATIDFDWEAGGPGSGVKRDGFSARWTRTLDLADGRYEFTVIADDGVRLTVDGQVVLDRWSVGGSSTTYTVTVPLRSGAHTVQLDYRDRTGEAGVALRHKRGR